MRVEAIDRGIAEAVALTCQGQIRRSAWGVREAASHPPNFLAGKLDNPDTQIGTRARPLRVLRHSQFGPLPGASSIAVIAHTLRCSANSGP
jgi:hypothetical protein